MPDVYTARLDVILPSLPPMDAVTTALGDIFSKIGLAQLSIAVTPPSWSADPLPPPAPERTEEEEMAAHADFDDGPEVLPPEPVPPPQHAEPAIKLDVGNQTVTLQLQVLSDIVVDLPDLDGVSPVLNPSGFRAILTVAEDMVSLGFTVGLGVRFSPDLLRPMRRTSDSAGRVRFERDESHPYTQIDLTSVSVTVDSTGTIDFSNGVGIRLTNPIMIGDTGIVIESASIVLNLSGDGPRPLGTPAGWKGLMINNASVRIPDIFSGAITGTGLGIGSGGVSGTIAAQPFLNYDPATGNFTGDLVGEVFGMQGGLEDISLTFQQNIPAGGSIRLKLLLPFFEKTEEPLDVDIGFTVGGAFTAAVHSPNGILNLTKRDVLSLQVESIGFEVKSGVFAAKLSGEVKPLFGNDEGLNWPAFKVKELLIDSNGNVRLEGGWLDLPNHYSLDFHGFQIEITKLGFGKTEDGGKWIGFSGSLKLVDYLPAGGSVEGLRITWYEDPSGNITDKKITFNGVGVELEVPDVLHFKGAVSYRELPENVHRFDGSIKLELISLDLQVDGTLVVGRQDDTNYMAIFLGVDLPAGIPLFATGLSIYGISGLFALGMEPNKGDNEGWYENPDGSPGWYKRHDEQRGVKLGVTDLQNKWRPQPGSLGLGAGVTFGTVTDNGYVFSGKILLAVILPGPIILLEGRASLLKVHPTLRGEKQTPPVLEEGLFRALAVLDNRAGTFLIGLDAQYNFGKLIDIRAGAEAFFSFNDASLWHIYLGRKDPREKRIRARLLSIFEANAYLMLDAHQLATGAWLGYDKKWEFGPLGVTLQAWIDGNAIISWKPVHFHGDLLLHGKAELHVFWIDLGMTVNADFAADVFDPFHIRAGFSVCVSMPWPFDNICADITLEWGPDRKIPAFPLPLKEIAVEHKKVTTSWLLPRGGNVPLLLPNYNDPNNDGFRRDPDIDPNMVEGLPPPANSPIVPIDCRPHLTFGRHVNDDAQVGSTGQPEVWERIGDPAKNEGPVRLRYGLEELVLQRLTGSNWDPTPVARKGPTPNSSGVPTLYGSWAPVPDDGGQNVGQTKLWLWSKTPFDYTRHTGRAWDDWFTDNFGDYPCVPIPPDRQVCCGFQMIDPSEPLRPPWTCPDEPEFEFSWLAPSVQTVTVVDQVEGTKALCFPGTLLDEGQRLNEITIHLLEPAKRVVITLSDKEGVQAVGYNAQGSLFPGTSTPNQPNIMINGRNLVRVVVYNSRKSRICILQICAVIGLDDTDRTERQELNQHLVDELTRWSQKDNVLEPYTSYRLKIVTTINASFKGELSGNPDRNLTQTEYAYFRTEGPPGLTRLLPPTENLGPEFNSGLDDLAQYVRQTVPATVLAPGELSHTPPRPVYRAYDVGVDFNENYVDLMFRLARRDLGLYLYDNNNRPVRDAQGRLIVASNRWGVNDEVTLTETDKRWITVVNRSDCASLDPTVVTHTWTLTSAAEGQVLDTDTVYEARLVPVLLNENFSKNVAGWQIVDEGDQDAPSDWMARGHDTLEGTHATSAGTVVSLDGTPDLSKLDPDFDTITLNNDTAQASRIYRIVGFDDVSKTVTLDSAPNLTGGSSPWVIPGFGAVGQTSNIWRRPLDRTNPVKPGTVLLLADDPTLPDDSPERPSRWTDYRLSLRIQSAGGGAFGIVFRYGDAAHYYRFSMAHEGRYRRLVRVAGQRFGLPFRDVDGRLVILPNEIHTILAEDDFVYALNQEYLITVEAIGSVFRVYQDGKLVFDVNDELVGEGLLDRGTIGLYTWRNPGVHFSDVRVDDFRAEAPVVYRFKFTTSKFANFFHQLHSFQDETWSVALPSDQPSDADLAAVMTKASTPESTPSDDESRAYEQLSAYMFGDAARQNPPEVQVTRLERNGQSLAFLLESPEPIDWKRTSLELLRADRRTPPPTLPGVVKLTDVTFARTEPNEESVTLLLREATDLTGHSIEYQHLPTRLTEATGNPILFLDDFANGRGDSNALQHYTVIDEGTENGPSVWRLASGALIQTSNIGGGSDPAFPGTQAVSGGPTWTDYRLVVRLRTDTDRAVGILFRYVDRDNYYRLSVDRQRNGWQLIKKENGTVTLLQYGPEVYTVGEPFTLTADAIGSRLAGYMGSARLFERTEATHLSGRIGLYCWANNGARFERVEVRHAPQDAHALLRDRFAAGDVNAWNFEPTGAWSIVGHELRLVSNTDAPEEGTRAVAGDAGWTNVVVSVRFRSEDFAGVMGLLIRSGDSDYYRFSMDFQSGFRRLVKKKSGSVSILWEDTAVNTPLHTYEVTVVVIENTLRGYLDGLAIFVVEDNDLPVETGRIGLFAWRNSDARFFDVRVYPADQAFNQWLLDEPFDFQMPGRWSFVEEGDQARPAGWQVSDGELQQKSAIFGTGPDMPGTYTLTGDLTWTDYRLTVRVRSGTVGTLGVMFRFEDSNSYYRLALDFGQQPGGLARLVKKVRGTVSLLWQHPGRQIMGPEYVLVVECVGDRLAAYLNGAGLFVLNDSDLRRGRIGLYTWRNPDARFAEVRVAAPVWDSYYRFQREVPLPAGTRVRVHSGNMTDAPEPAPEDAGVVQRFVASLDDRGRVRLPRDGTMLRLLAPDGKIGHARMFLPDDAYAPLPNAKVIRKRDGTGFFLMIMPAGSSEVVPLVAAQHRLEMTYRRNNQSNDPDSLAFSEAGNTGDEKVMIDIP